MRSILFTILAFLLVFNVNADIEPNNIFSTATTLVQSTSISGTQSDDDWYKITVTGNANKRVLIDLVFTHADGDINMTFWGGAAADFLRDASTGNSSDDEFIENVIPIFAVDYFIQVTGANLGNSYTLTWTEVIGNDDLFEPNNSSATAQAIPKDVVNFGKQLDEDWYSIDVASGFRRVLASLRFRNTNIDVTRNLDLELFDSNGISLALSASASGINESINVVVPTAGTYNLKVTGDNNGDGYALDWMGVNEAPQAIANTVSTTENIPYNFEASDFTFSDSENDSLVSATLSSLSLAGGTLTHSIGTAVSNADTLTAAQLGTLVYTPLADTSASPLASFAFRVNDIDLGTVPAQLTINVTAAVVTPPAAAPPADTGEGGGGGGAFAPLSLLALLLTGLLRRKRC